MGLWGGLVAFWTDSAQDAASVSRPTTDDGYTSIGVGQKLYAWPNQYISSQVDVGSIPGGVSYNIDGNSANTSLFRDRYSPSSNHCANKSNLS